MIAFLRFIGIVNAAVWLGTSIFFTLGAGPAIFSETMQEALKLNTNFSYFAGVIASVILKSYFHFHVICGIIALLHLLAEKLYLGRHRSQFTSGLLVGLLAVTLLGGFWLQPKMHQLHQRAYSESQPEVRAAAMHSFYVWHGVSQVLNLFIIGGILIYVWRVNNPPDTTKFVRTGKFRG